MQLTCPSQWPKSCHLRAVYISRKYQSNTHTPAPAGTPLEIQPHADSTDIPLLLPYHPHVPLSPFCPRDYAELCRIWAPRIVVTMPDSLRPKCPKILPVCILHKQTEKLALNIVCYEFYKLHSRQPLVKQDDTWQPLIACSKSGRAGLLIWPYFLHPNPAHNVVVGQIPNLYLATCHMFIQSVILRCIYVI